MLVADSGHGVERRGARGEGLVFGVTMILVAAYVLLSQIGGAL